ncbi:MAG: SCO family protein [Myxococcales bacterium]|nr:SCO family protein [Myxococcales bacterium]
MRKPALAGAVQLFAWTFAAWAANPRPQEVEPPEVPDVRLLDQEGRTVRFKDELRRGRVVAVNFVYTTCSTSCGPMTAIFSALQRELGASLGREVRLVSVSIDPRTDTPERLRRFAKKFDRREGWTFFTGPPDRLARLFSTLGAPTDKANHTPMVLIGNERARRWVRLYGLVPPSRLAEEIRRLLDSPKEE